MSFSRLTLFSLCPVTFLHACGRKQIVSTGCGAEYDPLAQAGARFVFRLAPRVHYNPNRQTAAVARIDPLPIALYSEIRLQDFITMTDSDIVKLEKRIDELIELCDSLKNENTLLRDRQEILVEERAKLIEKAEMARVRVEAMLIRLKAMEHEP